ncbi:MAG: hypothetical protein OXG85_01870 [Chloroflexi bacterium]|nr:hypothetical protein [Chloroflexota bacterium]
MASVCSPYTDYALRQLDELAATYQVDGFWLDIIPLARDVRQDLWMIAPHPIPDYSLYAQRGSMVFGQAPFATGASDPAQLAGLAGVFLPTRELEAWLTDASGLSDIGLIMAPKPRSASRLWSLMLDGAEAFHDALIDRHLPIMA